jgi:hypothetical protein
MADLPSLPEGAGPPPSARYRSRSGYRRAFWVSLGISALFHLGMVLLYPSLLVRAPVWSPPFGPSALPARPLGTELLNLQELPAEENPDVLPPEEIPDTEVPAVEIRSPDVGAGENPETDLLRSLAPGPTAAERLRPRAGDLRLWAPVDPELTKLSETELMRLLLSAELEDLADSMAVAEELARRATDWTYTDDEGRKWGVSPGKLHLGDITIPLPFGFGVAPFTREQNAARLWAWDDINQAAGRKGVQDVWKERAEAIRRRMEAERKPDTTGVRR